MPQNNFNIFLEGTLGANGTLTLSYQASTNEELVLSDLFHVSAGAFDVTDIYTGDSKHYMNATSGNGIPNTLLKDGADDNHGLNPFKDPLTLKAGQTFYIDLLDVSGSSNLVSMVIPAIRNIK